ncbi:hypothetical protein TraAM80_06575 [Trypanosoma rangeli]|uniref:Uncharacterized protein n=1 Tax=Trypanosoma rangeli TaxID=5698 RepID=A0A422N9J0_TRYRA|nr:uncharacterized protein TraAM80_06575 [Trypanosoma rangeli]RNF02149.1 hypothetical protein TraAM80_06575 [Trypanosoma rangeli]|eukprot:RNF02149.1 hypothetical protein TraAM80_06575 [Trypanosoma rangeli]
MPARRTFRHFNNCGGKMMPRYYYFGIELSERRDAYGVSQSRKRRLFIFATDVKRDQQTWLGYFVAQGEATTRSASGISNARSNISMRFDMLHDRSNTHSVPRAAEDKERHHNSHLSYDPLDVTATRRPRMDIFPLLMDDDDDDDDDDHNSYELRTSPTDFFGEKAMTEYFFTQLDKEEARWRHAIVADEDHTRQQLCAITEVLLDAAADNITSFAAASTQVATQGGCVARSVCNITADPPCSEATASAQRLCIEPVSVIRQILHQTLTAKNHHILALHRKLDELQERLVIGGKQNQELENSTYTNTSSTQLEINLTAERENRSANLQGTKNVEPKPENIRQRARTETRSLQEPRCTPRIRRAERAAAPRDGGPAGGAWRREGRPGGACA